MAATAEVPARAGNGGQGPRSQAEGVRPPLRRAVGLPSIPYGSAFPTFSSVHPPGISPRLGHGWFATGARSFAADGRRTARAAPAVRRQHSLMVAKFARHRCSPSTLV